MLELELELTDELDDDLGQFVVNTILVMLKLFPDPASFSTRNNNGSDPPLFISY